MFYPRLNHENDEENSPLLQNETKAEVGNLPDFDPYTGLTINENDSVSDFELFIEERKTTKQQQRPYKASGMFDISFRQNSNDIELVDLRFEALAKTLEKAKKAFSLEYDARYACEFWAVLDWFDVLIQLLSNNEITFDKATGLIREFLKNRWESLKRFPALNLTTDKSPARQEFFFEVATQIVDSNEPICHVLMPGVTVVIPDEFPLQENSTLDQKNEALKDNTEQLRKQDDKTRRLIRGLIHINEKNRPGVLLDSKTLFTHALSNDSVFFDPSGSQNITLTPLQKKTVRQHYPDLYELFLNNYLSRHEGDFNQLMNELIKAVEKASSHKGGKGKPDKAEFDEAGIKAVSNFYQYWIENKYIRESYGRKICRNEYSLQDNLIVIFSGALAAGNGQNSINLAEDLGVTQDHINEIMHPLTGIFSCQGLMAEKLREVQNKIASEKKITLDQNLLDQFDFHQHLSSIVNPEKLLPIRLIAYHYGQPGKPNDIQTKLAEIYNKVKQKKEVTFLSSLMDINELAEFNLVKFFFKEEMAGLSNVEIKQLFDQKWLVDKRLALKIAQTWIRAQLKKTDNINNQEGVRLFCDLLKKDEPLLTQHGYKFSISLIDKLCTHEDAVAFFTKVVPENQRNSVIFKALTGTDKVNKFLEDLIKSWLTSNRANDILEKAKKHYTQLKSDSEPLAGQFLINFSRIFSDTSQQSSMNAIDYCSMLVKNQSVAADVDPFETRWLEVNIENLAAKNPVGMGLFIDSLSKNERQYLNDSINIRGIDTVKKLHYQSMIAFLSGATLIVLALMLPATILAVSLVFLSILTPLIGFCSLVAILVVIPITLSLWQTALDYKAHPILVMAKIQKAFSDFFSFHPEKNNSNDFWLSTDSRYQTSDTIKWRSVLTRLAKTGKDTLKAFKPFKSGLEAVNYFFHISIRSLKGCLNILAGLGKMMIITPFLFSAGLGQVLANRTEKGLLKSVLNRTAINTTQGLAQIAYGAFQIVTALPALLAPITRFAVTVAVQAIKAITFATTVAAHTIRSITSVFANPMIFSFFQEKKAEKKWVEVKKERAKAIDECIQILDDQKEGALATQTKPCFATKEDRAFRAINRSLQQASIPSGQNTYSNLRTLSFFNTNGQIKPEADKPAIRAELEQLKTAKVRSL